MEQKQPKPTEKKTAFWSDEKSIALSRFSTAALLVIAVALLAAGPWLIDWLLANKAMRSAFGAARGLLYLISYGCGAAAMVTLVRLYGFLDRVAKGQVFTPRNVAALRAISWCCFIAAVLALAAGVALYLPFLFIAAAAGFMALIVRVIKNAFGQAVHMKNELDFTV